MFENKGLLSLIGDEDKIDYGYTPYVHFNPDITTSRYYVDVQRNPLPIEIKETTRWFRRYTHYYLNDYVRVEFGFHLYQLGESYWLQHKIDGKWKKRGWTYGLPHNSLLGIIRYLVE